MTEVIDLIRKQNEVFEAFKVANDQKLAEIETEGKAHGETLAKLDIMAKDMGDLRDQVKDLEAKATVPLRDESGKTEEQRAHIKAFDHWARNPKDPAAIQALNDAATARHQKAVTISGTGGGNAIPTEVHDRIGAKVAELSPIRQIANVARSSNENRKFTLTDDNDSGGWAGAGDTRSETTTALVQSVALTYGTVYAYPKAQEEALNDIEFDVVEWLVNTSAHRLAVLEGAAFVSGNGTSKPTGFLNGTPVTTGDDDSPARTFGVLQYFASGKAGAFPNDMTGSPAGNPATSLFSTVYGLKAAYRANARWLMNRTTLSTVMQFRDANGNYLFRPAATAGIPGTLMGFPLLEAEDMPDIGSNTFPVAFGDFNQGYQIADIVDTLRITMDDNITTPGFTKFYVRRRVGGKLLNDDAIKVIKAAAS